MKLKDYGISRLKARLPIWMAQAKTVVKREGVTGFVRRSTRKAYRIMRYSADPTVFHRVQYGDWLKNIEPHYLKDEYQQSLLEKIGSKKKFSVIFPVWNKSDEMLSSAIESVLAQSYPNFELCISDGSTKDIEHSVQFLREYEKKYPGIIKVLDLREKYKSLPTINLIENTNNALSVASGDYCVFMDCDDELSPNCLLELASAIKKHPHVEFLYSDFDKIDENGNRFDPSFWADWSPHTILSVMYTTHVTCYRKDIIHKLEGLRKDTAGAQDWDLVLRYRDTLDLRNPSDREKIIHIPKILYHWRVYSGSTALPNSGAKNWAYEAQREVLTDWAKRNNEKAEIEDGPNFINYRIRFAIHNAPKVSIIIPFRDNVKYLQTCLPSIYSKTNYENYEILLVDNQSKEQSTHEYLKAMHKEHHDKVRLLTYDHPYHFGKLNTWAATQTDAEHLLFLNNDTKVINSDWLSALLEYSQREEIGCVGAKLLYPNNMIQHAGVIVGLGGAAAHAHRMIPNVYPGYNGWLVGVRNVLAVTGACLVIKRKLFEELHGFDEQFDPGYQDVDLGIRAYEAGYWNVYTPYAQLYHYESVTRHSKQNRDKLAKDEDMAKLLRQKWSKYVDIDYSGDPFYNVNLSVMHEDFRLKTEWYPQIWGKRAGLVQ